ncbi:MAG: DMT family transporter [Rhodobacterales bacterium]|nr:DMT family transporter [Rhodobacterales bacterium]
MSNTTLYALTMLAAGFGIPILAALNAALGVRLGSPVAAGAILFCVALSATVIALLITGPAPILQAPSAPKHLFLAGFLVAFYVLSITYVAPHFGIGNAVFFVLLARIIHQTPGISFRRTGSAGLTAAF